MRQDIRIDWCPVARVADLQHLIDNHWRRGHVLASDETLLRWQYRHLTSPDHLAIMVAINTTSDELIGCLGLIHAPFNDRGRKRLALWMSMWLLVPDARGQGIGFSLLERAIREGHEVIACVGFNDITKRLVNGMGFHVRDAVPRWIRPVDPSPLLSLTGCREQSYSASIRSLWAATIGASVTPPSRIVEPWSVGCEGAWDEAWQERFAPNLIATWHDSEYLRWRYLNHPSFTYHVSVARGASDRIDGVLVHRVEEVQGRSERILRIVDLLGEPEAVVDLVAHALIEAAAQGVAFVDFHSTANAINGVLVNLGFYRDDEQPESDRLPRFFQPLDFRSKPMNFTLWTDPKIHPDPSEYVLSSELYFTRADGDQDRPN